MVGGGGSRSQLLVDPQRAGSEVEAVVDHAEALALAQSGTGGKHDEGAIALRDGGGQRVDHPDGKRYDLYTAASSASLVPSHGELPTSRSRIAALKMAATSPWLTWTVPGTAPR